MYADQTYYTTIFRGTLIPSEQLDSYLQRASDDIDQLTLYRIPGKGGAEELTAFQLEQVKKAVCFQAEYLYNLEEFPEGLESYSLNGTSLKVKKKLYSAKTVATLKPTGLLYGGLY